MITMTVFWELVGFSAITYYMSTLMRQIVDHPVGANFLANA